jgi:hypothetical protein
MLTGVHRGPPPSVTWADRNGCVLADAREPRRMRPHLSPAGPTGRCQQRGPHPAACTVPAVVSHRRSSRPDGAARRGAGRHHRGLADLPSPGEPSSRSHDVTCGGARPARTQRRFLVPLVTSGSDRVLRERLLIATVVPWALLLGVATATMTSDEQGVLVVALVGVESGLASAFRQVQAAPLPWLARTPDEPTSANTAASVRTGFAMSWSGRDEPPAAESASKAGSSQQPPGTPAPRPECGPAASG